MTEKLLKAEREYAKATTDLIQKRAALRDAELAHGVSDREHKEARGKFIAEKEKAEGLVRDDDE